jgi:cytochrome P450
MPCPFHQLTAAVAQLARADALDPALVIPGLSAPANQEAPVVAAPRPPVPAPPAHWLLGHLPEMTRDLLGFYVRCERDFGPVVPLRVYNIPFFVVNDPELIRRVLVTDDASFVKPTGLLAIKPLLGEGLATSDGEFWRSQRALIQPAFHKKSVDGYAGAVIRCTAPLLESWQTASTCDVYQAMCDVTLDALSQGLLGINIGTARDAVFGALVAVQEFFNSWRRHYLPLPAWLPLPASLKLRKAVRELDDAVCAIIASREGQLPGSDLLSRLLAASRPDGTKLSRRLVRDELVTMFLAGHETSSAALSWALFELSRCPQATATLRNEIDGVLAGRTPQVQDLPSLPYLDHVVKEVLRLYPSVYNVGRVAKDRYEIAGHVVEGGQNLITSQWAMHRSARYYEDPDAFVPERWATERARGLPKFAYFPFSGGPRNCIGAQFALLEMKLILASVIARFDFELEPGVTVRPEPALSLRPSCGMPMRVRPRGRL